MTSPDPGDEDDLIRRLAAWAAYAAAEPLPSPATAATLERAEQMLGFTLHPLLRRVYAEIADGGFGPGHGLNRLFHVGFGAVDSYPARIRTRSNGKPWWPREVIPILHWGGGLETAVDCRSPGGTVLLYEPNAGPDETTDAWFVESASLARWLESWILSSTGNQLDTATFEITDSVFWDGLTARLAEADFA